MAVVGQTKHLDGNGSALPQRTRILLVVDRKRSRCQCDRRNLVVVLFYFVGKRMERVALRWKIRERKNGQNSCSSESGSGSQQVDRL